MHLRYTFTVIVYVLTDILDWHPIKVKEKRFPLNHFSATFLIYLKNKMIIMSMLHYFLLLLFS